MDSTFKLPMADSAMREMVKEMMSSRKYWIFLPGVAGFDVLKEIRRRFYSTAKEDFKQMMAPIDQTGFYGIAWGLKSRLKAESLAALIREQPLNPVLEGCLTGIDLLRRDIICLASAEEGLVLLNNFYEWVSLDI